MTTQRTDVHRPSAINPAEYEYVAPEHIKITGFGDCAYVLEMRRRIQAHMAKTGGTYSGHEHGGNCMVCGSVNAIYTILFYHRPTNTYIRTGQDCADKLDMGYNRNEINLFHTAMKQADQLRSGKRKAQDTLIKANVGRAWDIVEQVKADRKAAQDYFDANQKPDPAFKPGNEELTLEDIVGKLVKYGSVSDNQIRFIQTLIDRIDNRAAVQAQRQAEADAASPVPTGRVKLTGTVIALKDGYEGFRGEPQTKVLIKANEGYKVWGNRFANVQRGDVITFTATLEPSKDDTKFGFFKRAKIEADANFQPVNGVITRVA